MDKRDRERVDKLVEIYVNHFTADDGAGWASKNQLQTLKEHAGEMPGGGGKMFDRMVVDITRVRSKHSQLYVAAWLLGYVKRCSSCKLSTVCPDCGGTGISTVAGELPSRYAVPLIASGVYSQATNQQVADFMGLTLKQYETRLATGRLKMFGELRRLDRLRLVRDKLGRTNLENVERADRGERGLALEKREGYN